MVTGRARSQSRPVRRLSTRVPASIASSTQVVGIRRSDTRPMVERLRFDCPLRIESVATDSLMDKPLGIDSTRGCAVRSFHKNAGTSFSMQATFERDRIRSNCAAAKSLSIWLSLGGMDGN